MARKYDSTLLAQDASPIEIQKADLDLLKKINEIGSGMSGAWYVGSQQDGLTSFSDSGWITLSGGAINYNDINIPISTGKVPAANFPAWTAFVGNNFAYTFAVNDHIQLAPAEMLHDWQEGSNIELHIHWATNGMDTTDRGVKWEIEYTLANVSLSAPMTYTSAVIVSSETIIPANTATKSGMYTSIATVDMTGYKIGSVVLCRLRRIASTTTAPTSNPFAIQVGIHYQRDTLGSRNLATK